MTLTMYRGDVASTFSAKDATLAQCAAVLEHSELQIALVVDDRERLLGTVTDGDIRRALLRGCGLETPVAEVMNTTPIVANEELLVDEGARRRRAARRVPVLSADGTVVGLALPAEELRFQRITNPVVVMAGGLGTRLAELTRTCPKPLLRVGDKPVLETMLERFAAQGFYRFVFSVNYRAEMIERYFGDGSAWGVEITYLRETKRLGTCGALGLLETIETVPEEPFFVINGDVLTKVNFEQMLHFHQQHRQCATMAVRQHSLNFPFGVVELDGHQVTGLTEKPTYQMFVNAGIYVLSPVCLDYIPTRTVLRHD